MKFRKRPVVIEAVQLRWENWSEICELAGVGKLIDGKPEGCFIDPNTRLPLSDGRGSEILGINIPTLEGLMVGIEGDWIIKGIKGEIYPCKDDIFKATYELVEE